MAFGREVCSRGIIWQIRPYGEKDSILTFFSAEEGKISLLAKGLRGEKSKRKGTIRPFALIDCAHTIPKGQNGMAQLTRSDFLFAPNIDDPVVFAELSFLAEVSDRFLESRQAVPAIFDLWEKFLRIPFEKPREEICGFLIHFFEKLGLLTDLQKCGKCGEKLSAEKNIVWKDGESLSCCEKKDFTEISPAHKHLSFEELKSLYFYQQVSPELFSRLALPSEMSLNLINLLFQEIRYHSEKPFITKRVFEALLSHH